MLCQTCTQIVTHNSEVYIRTSTACSICMKPNFRSWKEYIIVFFAKTKILAQLHCPFYFYFSSFVHFPSSSDRLCSNRDYFNCYYAYLARRIIRAISEQGDRQTDRQTDCRQYKAIIVSRCAIYLVLKQYFIQSLIELDRL